MKRCSKCGATKPLEDFHRETKGKDGRAAACRDCKNAARTRDYRTCPDCGWTTSPDAPNHRRSLSIHATHCTGVLNESPGVLRGGRWALGPRMVRVWVPDEKETA